MEIGKEVRTSHSDDDDYDYHDDDDDSDVYYAIKWIRNLITAPQIAHRNSRRKILISYTIPLFSYIFFLVLLLLLFSFALNIFCISFLSRCFALVFLFCFSLVGVYTYFGCDAYFLFPVWFSCTLNVPFDVIPKRFVPTTYYNIYFYGGKNTLFSVIIVDNVFVLKPSTTCRNARKYSNYTLAARRMSEIREKMANTF